MGVSQRALRTCKGGGGLLARGTGRGVAGMGDRRSGRRSGCSPVGWAGLACVSCVGLRRLSLLRGP